MLPDNEFSNDLEYQPSMDKWYHIIQANRLKGESVEECETRLRSYVGTDKAVKFNWKGKQDGTK